MHHGNLKVCQPKNVLLLPLLIIVFLHQLKGAKTLNVYLVFKGSCLKQKTQLMLLLIESILNIYNSKLDTWSRDLNPDFTLKNCLFRGVKLAKNTDPDEYVHSRYGIGFDSGSEFSLPNGSIGQNVIIFELDMTSSVHSDNKGKDILIFGR